MLAAYCLVPVMDSRRKIVIVLLAVVVAALMPSACQGKQQTQHNTNKSRKPPKYDLDIRNAVKAFFHGLIAQIKPPTSIRTDFTKVVCLIVSAPSKPILILK